MLKCGPKAARTLRRRQARPRDICSLDEIRVEIAGRFFRLRRSVGENEVVLNEFLRSRPSTPVAKRLLTVLIRQHGLPRDGHTPARRRSKAPGLKHRTHKGAKTNHPPLRNPDK